MAIVKTVLQHIHYALDKGAVPVVDLRNHKCQYHAPGEFGKINIWERFFEQPGVVSLDAIPCAAKIVLSSQNVAPTPRYFISVDSVMPDKRAYLRSIANLYQQCIRPSQCAQKLIEQYITSALPQGGSSSKIIGVLCRGTDYLYRQPVGHPIQPPPQTVLADVVGLKSKLNYEKVFLATEDARIMRMFKTEFGDDLLTIGQKTFDIGNKQFLSDLEKDAYNYFEGPLRYFAAMKILSQCKWFVGGITAGTLSAFLMSKDCGFEYEHIYNLGKYPLREA